MGLPVVENDGEVQLTGQGQLGAQHLLLELPGRVLSPVVVQTDLTDGRHLGLARQRPQGLYVRRGEAAAVLRVDAHGGVDVGVRLGIRRRRLAGGRQVAAGVQDKAHPLRRQADSTASRSGSKASSS